MCQPSNQPSNQKKNLFEQWQLVLVLALALADDWH
jgi:hypothetical protein